MSKVNVEFELAKKALLDALRQLERAAQEYEKQHQATQQKENYCLVCQFTDWNEETNEICGPLTFLAHGRPEFIKTSAELLGKNAPAMFSFGYTLGGRKKGPT